MCTGRDALSRALLIARILREQYFVLVFRWFCLIRHVTVLKVVTVRGFHLFPFRTEQLSPAAPMVLRQWESR